MLRSPYSACAFSSIRPPDDGYPNAVISLDVSRRAVHRPCPRINAARGMRCGEWMTNRSSSRPPKFGMRTSLKMSCGGVRAAIGGEERNVCRCLTSSLDGP